MVPLTGFSLQAEYDRPMDAVIALLRQAGFSAVSPVWSTEAALCATVSAAEMHQMTVQSLHAPTRGIPHLWRENAQSAEAALDAVLQSIDACKRFRIPVMVIHGWQGLPYTFSENALNFQYFDRMVAYAADRDVAIAFENLEGEEYLAALLSRYRDVPHVGFCWDSGHDRCYPHKLDFLTEYGDRLIMTHLHDNLGIRDPKGVPTTKDDLHYLPGDGNLDWAAALSRLRKAPIQKILNFELKTKTRSESDCLYDRIPLEQFLTMAGQRAQKIAWQYASISE